MKVRERNNMANIGHFYGFACTNPTVIKDDEIGIIKSASVYILTITSSRRYEGANEANTLEFNQIMVRSGVPEMAARIAMIRSHDIIILKGSINTRNVPKAVTCQECFTRFNVGKTVESSPADNGFLSGEKNYACSMVTFITPIDLDIRFTEFGDIAAEIRNSNIPHNSQEEALNEITTKALDFIREHREMSNEIIVIGNLCKAPEQWQDGRVTAYQLGVNRRYYLKDDDPSIYSDYPYIRSMGRQADNDIEALHANSRVLVDGFVRLRKFKRSNICPNCGVERVWIDKVLEIVPYVVEYLDNYKSSSERKKEKNLELSKYNMVTDKEEDAGE